MAEYSRLAKGRFVSTGAAKVIYLPFQPDYVEFINYTAAASGADNGVPNAYWDSGMGQGFTVINRFQAANQLTTDTVDVNGISTFSAGLMFQFGAKKQVVSTTKATGNFEVTAHGYATGDIVMFQGLYSTQFTAGFAQLDGIPFEITVVDANNFTINWDTNQSNFTDLAASPAGATVMKVLYPFLYAPGVSFIAQLSLDSATGFTNVFTTASHNYVVGQEVAFRIPPAFGSIELNSLPNVVIPGSPKYYYVVSISSNQDFVVNVPFASLTAFNDNQTIASVSGMTFPQVVAVGDVNTDGEPITATSVLYPPPAFPTFANRINTINGPAIRGAFVNNTRQGFVIGSGVAQGDSSAVLVGATNDVIYWRAFLHDLQV